MTPELDLLPPSSPPPAGLPEALPTETLVLAPGAEVELRVAPVTKRVGGATLRMLAYNGSIPGPTLRVRQGSEISVRLLNEGDLETTVHWHGLRLDNKSDGTTLVQPAVPVGGRFSYRLSFPDPGIYWYHPHIREDYGQEMGLYGNIVVEPRDADYWPAVDRELVLTLDDILIEDGRVAPFHRSHVTYSAMGRYGNVLLVNGETALDVAARPGEVVRLFLTNTANSRVFSLALPGATMKLVGGDSGRYERETFVDSVTLAPSERAVVDVFFERAGEFALTHRSPRRTEALVGFHVAGAELRSSAAATFATLRADAELAAMREALTPFYEAAPDKTLALVAEMEMEEPELPPGAVRLYVCPMHPEVTSEGPSRCPKCGMKLLPADAHQGAGGAHGHGHDEPDEHGHDGHDEDGHGHCEVGEGHCDRAPEPAHGGHHAHGHDDGGIEWEDDMAEVNRRTTPANTRWKLVDRESGASGDAIDWRFRVGERIKIRLVNEMDSDHPMHHPFHIHGAGRFLILSRDGAIDRNLVWKDTVLISTGQTVDILLDVTHPGVWMAHCHIAEHHESGMHLTFRADA